jgi:hypothetical protein
MATTSLEALLALLNLYSLLFFFFFFLLPSVAFTLHITVYSGYLNEANFESYQIAKLPLSNLFL